MKIVKSIILLFALVAVSASSAQADEKGMITKKSQFSVKVTIDRLEDILNKKGVTIVTRWNHSDRARNVSIPVRDTELLIFGNPKLGSHFFTSNQTAGIDLPLKALAWEDAEGQVWLTYNDPQYVAGRHSINNRTKIVKKMTGALNMFTNVATGSK